MDVSKIFSKKKLTEVNNIIVFYYFSQIFRKIFYTLNKLSYMNELMYNFVTWSDWSVALMHMLCIISLFFNFKNWALKSYWMIELSGKWVPSVMGNMHWEKKTIESIVFLQKHVYY